MDGSSDDKGGDNIVIKDKIMSLKAINFLPIVLTYLVSINGENNLYSFSATNIHNEEISLELFRDQVVLIVNVASECGYTDSHYKDLQRMYKNLGQDGYFTILGFPCNQFGGQEPNEEKVIDKFLKEKYNIQFPMFSKVDVIGENAHPLWKYLIEESGKSPNWNFFKYLVDHTGKVVDVFPTRTSVEEAYDKVAKYVKRAKKHAKQATHKIVKKELRDEF